VKRLVAWTSVFVVGGTTAVVGHLAIGILLFEDGRMFQALTVILGVEWGALALGLGSAVHRDASALDSLRRRWVLLLAATTFAAGFVLVWTWGDGLEGTPLTQGAGLALLGGLPLYTSGLVLRALSVLSERSQSPFGVAGPAALGACTGILFTGTVGITKLGAPSLLLLSMMLLSALALAQGWLFEDQTSAGGVARSEGGRGEGEDEEE
jgi:hypothetical protein